MIDFQLASVLNKIFWDHLEHFHLEHFQKKYLFSLDHSSKYEPFLFFQKSTFRFWFFFRTKSTGKSFSEARNICRTYCVPKLFWMSKQNQQFLYTKCSAGILSLQFSWTMNNLSSYCGLVDAKISASEKY